MKEAIFVYGTLMSGFENNYILKDSELFGKAFTVNKYSMYARFIPYLSKEGKSKIFGEVYIVDEKVLSRLDMLEGHPDYYRREKIDVIDEDGDIFKAWCYIRDQQFDAGYTPVDSGNYYEYRFNNEKVKGLGSSLIIKSRNNEVKAVNEEKRKHNN